MTPADEIPLCAVVCVHLEVSYSGVRISENQIWTAQNRKISGIQCDFFRSSNVLIGGYNCMLYVRRDENGHIVAIQSEPIDGAEEFLSPADPEVTRFLSTNGSGDINLEYLTQSDNTLIRVMEDLIYLLVDKNVILFTELPPEAQHKLASRREARARMQHAKPFFVDEDELL